MQKIYECLFWPCFRHPDRLRVVWIRRNRRHMTRVRHSQLMTTLWSLLGFEKPEPSGLWSISRTAGNPESKTPREVWSSGRSRRRWTSQSLSLRFEAQRGLSHVTGGRDDSLFGSGLQEQSAEDYEDKDWTFVIENVSLLLSRSEDVLTSLG